MSGYALEYDAAVWRALPTADRAAAFALDLDEELRRERPDLTEVELTALRETAERASASRPRDASESFLFLPVDVGGIGIAHLSVVVPGADEVYDASDVVAADTSAPAKFDGGLAFMFETSAMLKLTPHAVASAACQPKYAECSWQALPRARIPPAEPEKEPRRCRG